MRFTQLGQFKNFTFEEINKPEETTSHLNFQQSYTTYVSICINDTVILNLLLLLWGDQPGRSATIFVHINFQTQFYYQNMVN